MKAWIVREKDEMCCTVVFAETRGKAKMLAQQTDCCEDVNFVDIECRRFPEADLQYMGRTEMDWCDVRDRIFLVKEAGWRCEYPEDEDCETCPASMFCNYYLDHHEEEAE